MQMNPFHANVWFLYPLKTSENLWFPLSSQYYISITPETLWCFQGIYKCIITKKWVNQKQKGKNEELNTTNCLSVFDQFARLELKELKAMLKNLAKFSENTKDEVSSFENFKK